MFSSSIISAHPRARLTLSRRFAAPSLRAPRLSYSWWTPKTSHTSFSEAYRMMDSSSPWSSVKCPTRRGRSTSKSLELARFKPSALFSKGCFGQKESASKVLVKKEHSQRQADDQDKNKEICWRCFLNNRICRTIITTNLLSRGFDMHNIKLVINFNVPSLDNGTVPDYENYIHRIGRAGR